MALSRASSIFTICCGQAWHDIGARSTKPGDQWTIIGRRGSARTHDDSDPRSGTNRRISGGREPADESPPALAWRTHAPALADQRLEVLAARRCSAVVVIDRSVAGVPQCER